MKYFKKYVGDTDFYTPCSGLIKSKLTVYNEYAHIHAKLFFRIINQFNLEFYVFAGTSIGYIRNKCNIPWADDYDILVFDKEIDFLNKEIIPCLEKNGFIILRPHSGLYHVRSNRSDKKYFQCDLFISKFEIDRNGRHIIRNISAAGLYDKKNITKNIIYPAKILKIDDLKLPFFNKMEEDISIEYGDVINNVCIHINHKKNEVINENFNVVYEEFYAILEKAKNNTLKNVLTNKEYKYENNCIVNKDTNFTGVLEALNYVSKKDVKNLYITDQKFLEYCLSIKYFFKEIKITLFLLEELEAKNLIFLNYVDFVKCKKDLSKIYEKNEIIYIKNKPIFLPMNIITFGTYDLFHKGHYNILKRAKELGDNLIVGVSSDELNREKGKISINNTKKRINDVNETGFADFCFVEESLDKKDEYIKKYKADILIMGDDWQNKFDWVSCPCIYLPRTPGISTTQLKNKQ